MRRYRILIVHDVELESKEKTIRWAYAHRSFALQKNAPEDFDVVRVSHKQLRWNTIKQYDLVFFLDYSMAPSYRRTMRKYQMPAKVVVSFNKDSNSRHQEYKNTVKAADWTIINNVERFRAQGMQRRTCCISNGIDEAQWDITTPIKHRPHKVLWAGSSGPAKRKGYHEVLRPLASIATEHGFDCDFRPINDFNWEIVKTPEEQREWYNSGSYYLNAAETEGTPSSALEAMACGCVYVSVPIGNVLEFGRDGTNCIMVERTVPSFLEGLKRAKANRERLSKNGYDLMHNEWSYGPPGHRAEYFFALFRSMIDAPLEMRPFNYEDIPLQTIRDCGGYMHEALKVRR